MKIVIHDIEIIVCPQEIVQFNAGLNKRELKNLAKKLCVIGFKY